MNGGAAAHSAISMLSPCLLKIVAALACAGAPASAGLASISPRSMSSKLPAHLARPPRCFSRPR
eukprot:4554780-Pyramimonas_sp.AAC.1